MNVALPGPLNDNPHLDRWVAFPSPGKVTVLTGRVELGQGVLTAMAQIAADELDVAMDRITIRSGDTEKAPNEGYTAGSQSIQFGGVALRQACADVRALFLDQAAKILGCKTGELSIRDGRIFRNGTSTGQGYVHRAAPARMTAAAFSTARMMRLWEPQRQMFPSSACAISTREGLGFLSSSALAEIRMPARQ